MRDISELNEKTSSYELFTHVYWCLVTRKISDFNQLVDYLEPLENGSRKDYVLKSAFPLIREIHWGFFRELNISTYPILWKELCLPHPRYKFAGELKRSLTITDIYCAFIDLHGYTALSRSSKDAPLLRLLDVCIETDVKRICRDNHVVGNRARGDEIILIGTSACDVVNSVMMIADYFGEKRLTADTEIVRNRRADRLKLPELSISAGIAGGKKYDSLVITAGGDLSGPVVNLAARLQSRANFISGEKSRILITETVRMKYQGEAGKQFAPMFSESQLAFLDVGPFAFKGVEVRITELLYLSEEMHRLDFSGALTAFLESLGSGKWKDSVFLALGELILAACTAMPPFKISGVTNGSLKSLSRRAMDRFEARDYTVAVSAMTEAASGLASVPDTDAFLVLYVGAVASEYRNVYEAYDRFIGGFVEDHRKTLFSATENRDFDNAVSCAARKDTMRSTLISRVDVDKRTKLWLRLIKDLAPSLEDSLYLGK